jgi:hypothetical protein
MLTYCLAQEKIGLKIINLKVNKEKIGLKIINLKVNKNKKSIQANATSNTRIERPLE